MSKNANKLPELRYKFLAVDQYGTKFMIEKHPRKELLQITGYSKASKMYIDTKRGTVFTGYVIGDFWFNVFGLEGNVFSKYA